MRTIFISVKVGDSNFCEGEFLRWCDNKLGDSYKFEWTQKNTDELYEKDPVFRKLIKAAKKARKVKEDYINKYN